MPFLLLAYIDLSDPFVFEISKDGRVAEASGGVIPSEAESLASRLAVPLVEGEAAVLAESRNLRKNAE